jgi:hypothetical protein
MTYGTGLTGWTRLEKAEDGFPLFETLSKWPDE